MKRCGTLLACCVSVLFAAGCVYQDEKDRRNAIRVVSEHYDKDCVRGFGGISFWAAPFESGFLVTIEDHTLDAPCLSALVYWYSDHDESVVYAVSDKAKVCSPDLPTVFDEDTTKSALEVICGHGTD